MARRVIALLFLLAACTPTLPSAPPSPAPAATMALEPAPTNLTASTTPTLLPAPSPGRGPTITARYPDGLPMWLDGSFVHRGAEAIDYARGRTDTTSFLVTGWATFHGLPVSCPIVLDGLSWQTECVRVRITDVAGTVDPELTDAITFRDLLAGFPEPFLGPIAASVHARDPRSTECDPDPRVCAVMMVVEDLVWRGDAATAPGPITPDAAAEAVADVQGSEMHPYGADLQSSACDLQGLYRYTVQVPNDVTPLVTCVQLGPSTEALQRAIDQAAGVAAALGPKAVLVEARGWLHGVLTSHVTYRWLVVDNGAFLVRTEADPTRRDRAFLERLVELLSPPA